MVSDALLLKVKTMLDYTASEKADIEKLTLLIEDGMQRLRSYAPDITDKEFEEPTAAREMLMSYVRYAHSNATELWKENYSEEITSFRLAYLAREAEREETCENQKQNRIFAVQRRIRDSVSDE